jgi:DNA-binding LacI/PurR family transcriptional regulator
MVEREGVRYRGCLLAASSTELDDFRAQMTALAGFGRPVVWFDRYDESNRVDKPRPVTRCHFSEHAGVTEALSFLRACGHRTVTFELRHSGGWQERRLRLMQKHNAESDNPLDIHGHKVPGRSDWERPTETGIDSELSRLERVAMPTVGEALAYFVRRERSILGEFHAYDSNSTAASAHRGLCVFANAHAHGAVDETHPAHKHAEIVWALLSLVEGLESGASALVCPNDAEARSFTLHHLDVCRIRVPEHMSILGFDNQFDRLLFPLTTVDWGFGYLGYQALHAILDDIPVSRNSDGDIPAVPHVVDHGTVARMREGERV